MTNFVTVVDSKKTSVVLTLQRQNTSTFQEKLVNGVNIKTINGQPLLGSGNLDVAGSSSSSSSNLSVVHAVDRITISNSSGTGVVLQLAGTYAGLMSPSQVTKLSGIEPGAQVNAVNSVAGRTGAVVLTTSDIAGLSSVAASGSYTDLTNKPTLGTAASLNVAATGNAAVNEVVKGNDTRLTDSRTASTSSAVAGDVTGTLGASVVAKINGVSVAGTPTAGQVPIASSGTASAWGTLTASQISGAVPAGAATASGLTMTTAKILGRTTAATGAVEEISVGTNLTLSAGSLSVSGLSTVATTGAYSSLSGLPTLGTASSLNVAATGNAAAGEVVKGSDSRLSDSRTALPSSTIAGDVTGTLAASTVAKINGVTLSGTPSSGQVLTATGTSAASWSTPASGVTNLAYTASATNGIVVSDTGTDATVPAADTTNAGLMVPAQVTKLAGIATGATANATDAQLRDRSTHTGTQLSSTVSDFSTAVDNRIGLASVNALADVTVTSPVVGHVLKWDGTQWINDTDATTGGGAGATNLSYTPGVSGGTVVSDTGTDATLILADNTYAGLMSATQYTKLLSVEAGAQINTVTSVAGRTGAVTLTTSDVSGLGTSAVKNVPATGDASSTQVVLGSDSRLTDARTPTTHSHVGSQVTGSYTAAGLTLATARLLGRTTAAAGAAEEISVGSNLTLSAGSLAVTGLSTVATSGSYVDLSNKPSLGTAASLNIPATGNAAAGEVVKGNDTRLSDSRTALSSSAIAGDVTGTLASSVVSKVNGITISGTPSNGQVLTASSATAASWSTVASGATNLSFTASPTNGTVTSSTGTSATLLPADATNSGLLLPAHYSKLAALSTVATTGAYVDLTGKPTLATVATSGSYTDLTNKPTLGTAAALDVPAAGNATTAQIVKGNDTRLVNAVQTGALTDSGLTVSTAKLLGRTTAATGAVEELTVGANLVLSAGSLAVSGLATVATSGAYSSLSGLPVLGTAAALNVSAAGNAASGEVVKGSDTRLTDSRTALSSTTVAGDVTGTLGALVVAKVNGIAVSGTAAAGKTLIAADATSAAWTALATVATTGTYSDLTGKPTLGTASALNVPATGNAAVGEVVKGSDTRLSDSRTALSTSSIAGDVTGTLAAATVAKINGVAVSGTPTANQVPVASSGTAAAWSTLTAAQVSGVVQAGALTSSGLTLSTGRLIGRTTALSGAAEEISVGSNLTLSAGSLSVSGLATVATTGAYADLSGKPTLGTAASLNVPATGNAATGEVVAGNDTRLTDSRTALSTSSIAGDVTGTLAASTVAKINGVTVSGVAAAGKSLIASDATNAAWTALATVATTGAYANLSGLPTLGTSAALNVPASGNAATGEVVKGSDTRLTDSRTALSTSLIAGDVTGTLAASTVAKVNGVTISGTAAASKALIATGASAASWTLLSTVATTGVYADLSGKPTLGTAAALDVPASGNATSAQVVKGSDTRLTGAVQTGALTSSGLTMSTSKLIGRTTAATGAIEELSVGSNLSLSSGSLNLSSAVSGLSSVSATTFTGALTGAASSNVLKSGDTMTGVLNLYVGSAATVFNVDSTNANGGYGTWSTNGTAIADIGTNTQITGTGNNQEFGINVRSNGGNGALVFACGNIERARINASGVFSYGGIEVGYRNQARVTGGLDNGKCYAATAGFTVSTGAAAGSTYYIYNNSSSAITLTQGSGLTLRLAGTATTGNRTLAAYGYAVLWFNSTTEAVLSGSGVS